MIEFILSLGLFWAFLPSVTHHVLRPSLRFSFLLYCTPLYCFTYLFSISEFFLYVLFILHHFPFSLSFRVSFLFAFSVLQSVGYGVVCVVFMIAESAQLYLRLGIFSGIVSPCTRLQLWKEKSFFVGTWTPREEIEQIIIVN